MNTLIQERHNQTETFIAVNVSRSVQKNEKHLAKEGSGLAVFRTDLGHIFGSNVGNDFGDFLSERVPHKPVFFHDLVIFS